VPGGSTQWKELEQLKGIRSESVDVIGWLRIPASPEATQHNVFVEKVSSQPATSRPPHRWLFGPGLGPPQRPDVGLLAAAIRGYGLHVAANGTERRLIARCEPRRSGPHAWLWYGIGDAA